MITHALMRLRPGAEYSVYGDTYGGIKWHDTNQTQPTEEEVMEMVAVIEQEFKNQEYKRKRLMEYPPIAEYIDAVVKGDQEAIQAYIDACLEVKSKYPKPE